MTFAALHSDGMTTMCCSPSYYSAAFLGYLWCSIFLPKKVEHLLQKMKTITWFYLYCCGSNECETVKDGCKTLFSEPLWICCTRRREAKLVDFPYYIFKAVDIYVIELRQVQANYVRTNISLGLFSAWLRGRDWQVSLCLHSVLLIEPLLTQGIFFFFCFSFASVQRLSSEDDDKCNTLSFCDWMVY